jgi:ElaB/YqjD/DUF883 family membrane-anchored ribosome-binding protein
MGHSAGGFNRARDKMADDLKVIVSDGEELIKAAASASGEGLTAARSRLYGRVASAKARLADLSQPVVQRAKQANDYVNGSPWTAVGVAAAAGLLIGLLVAKS